MELSVPEVKEFIQLPCLVLSKIKNRIKDMNDERLNVFTKAMHEKLCQTMFDTYSVLREQNMKNHNLHVFAYTK